MNENQRFTMSLTNIDLARRFFLEDHCPSKCTMSYKVVPPSYKLVYKPHQL